MKLKAQISCDDTQRSLRLKYFQYNTHIILTYLFLPFRSIGNLASYLEAGDKGNNPNQKIRHEQQGLLLLPVAVGKDGGA